MGHCDDCKKPNLTEETVAVKTASEITQTYDRQNKRLWVAVIVLAACLVVNTVCMVWAVQNAQRVMNEAVLEALYTASEIGVTTETTTTQTVEGDSATINNGEWEQYNDNAVNQGGGN